MSPPISVLSASLGAKPRLLIAGLNLCALLLFTNHASAQEKDMEACFSSYEETQVLLKSSDYVGASSAAAQCATGCPEEIALECRAYENELSRSTPSALLLARSERGTEAVDVQVELDGVAIESNSDHEVEMNPGPHTIRFSRDDGWEEIVEIVAHKGERRRQIRVTVPNRKVTTTEEQPPGRSPAVRNWTIASFTVGGLGFALAGVSGIIALQKQSDYKNCDFTCNETEISRLQSQGQTWLTVGDVGLIAGAVGVLGGTALLIWGTPSDDKSPQTALGIVPTPGGATGMLSGSF